MSKAIFSGHPVHVMGRSNEVPPPASRTPPGAPPGTASTVVGHHKHLDERRVLRFGVGAEEAAQRASACHPCELTLAHRAVLVAVRLHEGGV